MQNLAKITAYDKENLIKEFLTNNINALSDMTGVEIHTATDVDTALDMADACIANMSDNELAALCSDVLRVQTNPQYNANWQIYGR